MERVLTIPWQNGVGDILVEESADGAVTVRSDSENEHLARSQSVRFYTLKGGAEVNATVIQKGRRVILRDNAGRILRDKNGLILTALK